MCNTKSYASNNQTTTTSCAHFKPQIYIRLGIDVVVLCLLCNKLIFEANVIIKEVTVVDKQKEEKLVTSIAPKL